MNKNETAPPPSRTRGTPLHLALALSVGMTLLGQSAPRASDGSGAAREGAVEPSHPEAQSLDADLGCGSAEALARAYLDAIARHDAERIEQLQLPLLDECRTPETADLYRDAIEAEAELHLEPDPNLVVTEFGEEELSKQLDLLERMTGESFRLSERPSHRFELTARAPHPADHPCASQPARLRRLAARVDGCWRVVPQCLSPSMQKAMRESRISKQAVLKMQEELLLELDPEQRQRLDELLRERQAQAAFEAASELLESRGKGYRLIERLCRDL